MVARKRSKMKGGAYSNWGYAQAGNLDEGGGTLSKVEETEEKPMLRKMGGDFLRSLSPNRGKSRAQGRANLAKRGNVGDVDEGRGRSIYDGSSRADQLPTMMKWEQDDSDKKTAAIMRDKAMAEAKRISDEEAKQRGDQKKSQKEEESKCDSELRGCWMNCKAPAYRSKYDCDKCTDKIFDKVNAGTSSCGAEKVSDFKAKCDKDCREGGWTTQGKARLGNKKAREELKRRKGTFGDQLLQENEDRKRSMSLSPTLGRVAAQDQARLLQRPGGTDYFGNKLNPVLGRPHANDAVVFGEEVAYAIGGARRRRTKRRKTNKSKKNRRTKRTKRTRRIRRR